MDKESQPSLLVRGAEVWRNGSFEILDVLTDGSRIAAVGAGLPPTPGAIEIDASGLTLLPGFVDMHVHLRQPGYNYKETVATGTHAAARGGFTTVCAMPNVNPVPDSPEHLAPQLELIEREACVEVLPYGSITMKRMGTELVDYAAMAPSVAGFSDDGSGVQDPTTMLNAMRRVAPTGKFIAAHCEVNDLLYGGYIHDGRYAAEHGHPGICSASEWREVERDIRFAGLAGCPLHICHVSTAESVKLIRAAKERGARVTAETAPHYLAFCEDDLREEGRFKMNPPLRTAADRDALREAVADGTIDVIATDHAPHSVVEKSRGLKGSAMGVTGLETAFAAVNTYMVKSGLMSRERLVEVMSDAPRRILGLEGGINPGCRADMVLVDFDAVNRVDPSTFLSKGKSTPFAGLELTGEVMATIYAGVLAYSK